MPEIVDTNDTTPTQPIYSPDYYRQKVIQFQSLLIQWDQAYWDMQAVGAEIESTGDADAYNEWAVIVADLEARMSQARTVSEAINLASAGLNAIGVEFPKVQVPGLGAVPLLPIAGAVVAAWALVSVMNSLMQRIAEYCTNVAELQAVKDLPPDQQGDALTALVKARTAAQTALAAANASPINAVASAVKWGLLAFAAYYIYREYKGR